MTHNNSNFIFQNIFRDNKTVRFYESLLANDPQLILFESCLNANGIPKNWSELSVAQEKLMDKLWLKLK